MSSTQAHHASNRFGLGPRPDELQRIGADPRGWLQAPDCHQLHGLRGGTGMGSAWRHTVVMVVTEFGRTVAMNGTRGTAGMALVLGGAVNGGRVLGDWPGLARSQLRDGRDLTPATDLRSLYKGILRDHLGVTVADLESRVCPASRAAAAMNGLIKP